MFSILNLSVFKPGVCRDGLFAPIPVVVEQLLLCLDVPGGHKDQMRRPIDGVEPRLAVPTFTVVQQPSKTVSFLGSIYAVKQRKQKVLSFDRL